MYISHSIDSIENGTQTTISSSTETHESFPIHYGISGDCLKRNLTIMKLMCVIQVHQSVFPV